MVRYNPCTAFFLLLHFFRDILAKVSFKVEKRKFFGYNISISVLL